MRIVDFWARRTTVCPGEPARQSLFSAPQGAESGGKSGLRRIGCQVTPGGRKPTESATESKPPKVSYAQADEAR
jgi:hypothetical protein